MRQKNQAAHLIVWAFLLSLAGSGIFSPGLAANLAKENAGQKSDIKIQDFELFARRDISGASSNFDFIDNTVDKVQGLVNFDKGKLATNQAFAFRYLSIAYSKDAEGMAGNVKYNTALPAAVRNAEFEIIQNTRRVVTLPIAAFHNVSSGNTPLDQYLELGSIAVLEDVNEFEWTIRFPKNVSVPAAAVDAHHYLEIRLKGHQTVKKAA